MILFSGLRDIVNSESPFLAIKNELSNDKSVVNPADLHLLPYVLN